MQGLPPARRPLEALCLSSSLLAPEGALGAKPTPAEHIHGSPLQIGPIGSPSECLSILGSDFCHSSLHLFHSWARHRQLQRRRSSQMCRSRPAISSLLAFAQTGPLLGMPFCSVLGHPLRLGSNIAFPHTPVPTLPPWDSPERHTPAAGPQSWCCGCRSRRWRPRTGRPQSSQQWPMSPLCPGWGRAGNRRALEMGGTWGWG